jgi:hypothetical protein
LIQMKTRKLQQKKNTQMEKHNHHEIRQDIVDDVWQKSEACCQKTNRR